MHTVCWIIYIQLRIFCNTLNFNIHKYIVIEIRWFKHILPIWTMLLYNHFSEQVVQIPCCLDYTCPVARLPPEENCHWGKITTRWPATVLIEREALQGAYNHGKTVENLGRWEATLLTQFLCSENHLNQQNCLS